MRMKISDIVIRTRIRNDAGNLDDLVESIRTKGLINPITVNQDNVLMAGERRLKACEILGMEEVDVRRISTSDAEEELLFEIDENECRRDFSKAERMVYMKKLMVIEGEKARERQRATQFGNTSHQNLGGSTAEGTVVPNSAPPEKTRDVVAKRYGIGHDTLRKEMAITDNKDLLTPEDFADWDEGRLSTNKTFQKLREKMEEGESKARATEKELSDAQSRLKKLEAEKEALQKRIAEMEEDTSPADEKPEKVTSPVEVFYNSTVEYTGSFVTYMLSREGFMAMDSKDQEMFKDAVARLDNLCKRMKGYIV